MGNAKVIPKSSVPTQPAYTASDKKLGTPLLNCPTQKDNKPDDNIQRIISARFIDDSGNLIKEITTEKEIILEVVTQNMVGETCVAPLSLQGGKFWLEEVEITETDLISIKVQSNTEKVKLKIHDQPPPNSGATNSGGNSERNSTDKNPGHYYLNDGTFVESISQSNDVYVDGEILESITHDHFVTQAATIYGESSAYRASQVTDELKNEMKAIAVVHQKNKIAYGKESKKAKEYLDLTPKARSNSNFKKAATEAIIYAIKGGIDLSNGATMWDGEEQALFDVDDCHVPLNNKTIELHMNTMGWFISDALYEQWKKNIGESRFKAPKEKAAVQTAPKYNRGRKRLTATAVFGRTIFWHKINP